MDEDDQLPDHDEDLSALQGELVAVDDEDDGVVDTDDGGALVTLDDEDDEGPDGEFYDNLAETIPDGELRRIASTLIDLIAKDKDARKKRDEQYEEGLRRTGLGDDAPGGAQFQGASKVVHPMLTEACVDFAARSIKELWPANGPVKDHIEGTETAEKRAKAKRKTRLMNWQLTTQAKEARAELEQILTQLPLGGAQYLKMGWDENGNRPTVLGVMIDDMLIPFAATNFYSAQRKTHVQYLTQLDFEAKVKSGMYRDVDLAPAGMEPEFSSASIANDRIEGRNATSYNEDGLRTIYETYLMYDLGEDDPMADGVAPYIITVDVPTGNVLAIYRNWDIEDEHREELQWFVEFPFVPWRGAYPIGLPQMIGGLSAAATGALRALLDSAHIQNTPSGLKLKGRVGGQSLTVQPGQIEEVEGGVNVDDIRKLYMPMPYNPPSTVLFQLLGFLIDAGKGVIRTTLDDVADTSPNTPVGTTLSRLEQAMVVYSAIHGRLHDSMGRMLTILDRLNSLYLDDERLEQQVGEKLASREDFDGPMDVTPVSDPNIFSEAQRFAQVQAVEQRATARPDLYNARKVEERLLETLKIPNWKELLGPDPTPSERNAVDENAAAALGQPIAAFADQNHMAHIRTHLAFLQSPVLGLNELIAPTALPALLDHIKQHVVLLYATGVFHIASGTLGEDLGDALKDAPKDDATQQAVDSLLAEASETAIGRLTETLAPLAQLLAQLKQQAIQMMPQPQQDPRIAIEQQKVQMQGQAAQQKAQLDAQKLQIEQQQAQLDQQTELQRLQIDAQRLQQEQQRHAAELQAAMVRSAQEQQHEDKRTEAEIAAKLTMNQQDNQTALTIAGAEIAAGERSALSTGTGINP